MAGEAMGERARRDPVALRRAVHDAPRAAWYKTKSKGAQEAHESTGRLVPARPGRDGPLPQARGAAPLPPDLQRALASQMEAKELETTTGSSRPGPYGLRASATAPCSTGFPGLHGRARRGTRERSARRRRERAADEDAEAGSGAEEATNRRSRHHDDPELTEPPPRFTRRRIKALEEHGIGRPSTYAATISTIVDRGYVDRGAPAPSEQVAGM